MTSLHIVADENIYQVEHLSHLGRVTLLPAAAITSNVLKQTDVLLIRSKTQINQNLLANTAVKFVGSTVSGTEHIDFSYLQENDIKISVSKGCNANSVALYCLLTIFELQQKNGQKISLEHQTIGIVGYGKTANKLIDKLAFFNVSVVCYDPPYFQQQGNFLCEHHRSYVRVSNSLVDIMQCSIISLHPALHRNPPYSSYHLINQDLVPYLSSEHLFINTSRGEVVDEKALLKHRQKIPFSMGIDCWQNEPQISHNLLQYAQIATAHIAGHSIQAKLNGLQSCYDDLCQWLENEEAVRLPYKNNHLLPFHQTIDLSQCHHAEDVFFAIHREHYLPSRDHLEAQLCTRSLAEQFSQYRKHYPVRHELSMREIEFCNVPSHLHAFVDQIDKIL